MANWFPNVLLWLISSTLPSWAQLQHRSCRAQRCQNWSCMGYEFWAMTSQSSENLNLQYFQPDRLADMEVLGFTISYHWRALLANRNIAVFSSTTYSWSLAIMKCWHPYDTLCSLVFRWRHSYYWRCSLWSIMGYCIHWVHELPFERTSAFITAVFWLDISLDKTQWNSYQTWYSSCGCHTTQCQLDAQNLPQQ